jgi:hypothetical protein
MALPGRFISSRRRRSTHSPSAASDKPTCHHWTPRPPRQPNPNTFLRPSRLIASGSRQIPLCSGQSSAGIKIDPPCIACRWGWAARLERGRWTGELVRELALDRERWQGGGSVDQKSGAPAVRCIPLGTAALGRDDLDRLLRHDSSGTWRALTAGARIGVDAAGGATEDRAMRGAGIDEPPADLVVL